MDPSGVTNYVLPSGIPRTAKGGLPLKLSIHSFIHTYVPPLQLLLVRDTAQYLLYDLFAQTP